MHTQLTLSLLPPIQADLTDGMVGRNEQALASLAALMNGQQAGFSASRPPWLLLWGEPGCGKSFWLEAWSHARPDCPLLSTKNSASSLQALSDLTATPSQQGPQSDQPSDQRSDQRSTHPRVLLADDVDRWPQDLQQALFAYMAAQASRPGDQMVPLVMTSQAPAARLADLREDLRTRLGLALSFELHRLSEADMMVAMRQQAQALGWMAWADQTDFDRLFEYLLTRLPRHLGALKALMKKADEKALAEKRSLTLPLVRSLMDELFDSLSESTPHA